MQNPERPKRFNWSIPLLLLLAFVLGIATTWLIMRPTDDQSTQTQIESFLPPNAALSSPITASPPPMTGPPAVSQLAPADAARTLANWNYDRHNWTQAISHYQDAIAQGADNADVRTDLGNCFRFLNQPQKALEQYERAQKEDPLHENSLFNQISLYAQYLRDSQRAQQAARDFLLRFPQSPQAAAARRQLAELQSAPETTTPPPSG